MGCGFCCVVDCGFCCIGDFCSDTGCSYHPQPNNERHDHAKVIADELAAMKERARIDGEQIGKEAYSQINVFLNNFIDHLWKINDGVYGGKKLNIKMDVVERELNKLEDEVTEFVGNRMDERLVLTDPKLSVILANEDDEERKRRFDEFYVTIHRAAVRDLSQEIKTVIAKQFVIVNKEIRDRLDEVDQSMKDALDEYRQAEKMKMEKNNDLSSKQIEYMYRIDLARILDETISKGLK
ncbi:hypothetical protein [Megasphaera sp.]|jgi:hypothetical protein|uniref:hypothetical protein n=1 Tax=Megasphaera sp. TaxID=2023260 RepID=UPI0025D3C107|nr:hypothetical protein [uncultured Megasphaera sp.]